MRKHRHRQRGVVRRHGTLPGLVPILERLAALPEVILVTPARIAKVRGGGHRRLRATVDTATGIKLLARLGDCVQEIFVATKEPGEVRATVAGWRL